MDNSPNFDIARSSALGGVAHGFFGHSDGAHQFGYGGEGEDTAIRESRDNAWEDTATGRPIADALVTNTPDLVLGIVTADCAPVLFADKAAHVIGAAHAGWRGAHGGVLENTVAAMESLGARRDSISAGIGPTIAQGSYEVDRAFRQQFTEDDARFFAPGKAQHWQFDLPGYICARLAECGLEHVEDLSLDTYALENTYYSYRRATHCNAPNYGRQISMIALS